MAVEGLQLHGDGERTDRLAIPLDLDQPGLL
jgi:hypothetical protein